MKGRIWLTLLNWRLWLMFVFLVALTPVMLSQLLCRGLAILFEAADEAIEYTFSPVSEFVRRFLRKNKQDRVTP